MLFGVCDLSGFHHSELESYSEQSEYDFFHTLETNVLLGNASTLFSHHRTLRRVYPGKHVCACIQTQTLFFY